jgi:hypothetical protein
MYVTYSNRAAALLSLGLYREALHDANKCQVTNTPNCARVSPLLCVTTLTSGARLIIRRK